MIFPLILLALGIGVFAAYELSPTTHAWVDTHVQAVKDSLAAHDDAQRHLADATITATSAPPAAPTPAPMDPAVAQKLAAAREAAREAAKQSAIAAQTAKSPQEKAVATFMAQRTLAVQVLAQAVSERLLQPWTHPPAHVRAYNKQRIDEAQAEIQHADAELLRLGAPPLLAAGAGALAALIRSIP